MRVSSRATQDSSGLKIHLVTILSSPYGDLIATCGDGSGKAEADVSARAGQSDPAESQAHIDAPIGVRATRRRGMIDDRSALIPRIALCCAP